MKIAFALLALVSASAFAQPRASDDPALPCLATIENNPTLAPLRAKLGTLSRTGRVDFQALANSERPTESEKALISEWANERERCLRLGDSFRAQYAPPGWVAVFDGYQQRLMALMASLYAGEVTYGEFARQRSQLSSEGAAALSAVDQRNANLQMQAQAARNAQLAADNARTNAILQMLRGPTAPPPISPQVNCTSQVIGNQVHTRCN